MTYQEFMLKSKKILSITGGNVKHHCALPGGWYTCLLRHPDRIKAEPFFYTMVIYHPSFEKIKLLTMDYKKEVKMFWRNFTAYQKDRRFKMLERTREICKDILVINYNKSEYHDKGQCAS